MGVFLLFHGIERLAPLIYAVGFLGLIVAPCLAVIGLYRMYSGRVSDNTFRKSLYSIGIFTIVSFAIYASFIYFLVQGQLQIDHILYCLTIPFGLAASIVLTTQSTLIPVLAAVLVGVVLNVTAMIGFVSLFSDKKEKAGRAKHFS